MVSVALAYGRVIQLGQDAWLVILGFRVRNQHGTLPIFCDAKLKTPTCNWDSYISQGCWPSLSRYAVSPFMVVDRSTNFEVSSEHQEIQCRYIVCLPAVVTVFTEFQAPRTYVCRAIDFLSSTNFIFIHPYVLMHLNLIGIIGRSIV